MCFYLAQCKKSSPEVTAAGIHDASVELTCTDTPSVAKIAIVSTSNERYLTNNIQNKHISILDIKPLPSVTLNEITGRCRRKAEAEFFLKGLDNNTEFITWENDSQRQL